MPSSQQRKHLSKRKCRDIRRREADKARKTCRQLQEDVGLLPASLRSFFSLFAPPFTKPTFLRFTLLAVAAILTTGGSTLCNLLRTLGCLAPGDPSSYHRVISSRRWSPWRLGRALAGWTFDHLVGDGPILLAADDTVSERPGDKVYGKSCHRDAVRGSHPFEVRTHDFIDEVLGKAIPYGVYDLAANAARVSVGNDHDTSEFAVETTRRWWRNRGHPRYPQATELLITADGGGSNSGRCRLWKVALQCLADSSGLSISVCHYPPGTSKWNKIEHRLFGQITIDWRGKPLTSLTVIVELIAGTQTRTGLVVRAALDEGIYPIGMKVTDEQIEAVNLHRAEFHGEWNYTIKPSHPAT